MNANEKLSDYNEKKAHGNTNWNVNSISTRWEPRNHMRNLDNIKLLKYTITNMNFYVNSAETLWESRKENVRIQIT